MLEEHETTRHGDAIAGDIAAHDAYGHSGTLTLADVWNIIDQIHTNRMDGELSTDFLERWMRELEGMNDQLPAF